MAWNQGFTLVEAVIVMTIMTIVSYLVLSALPIARTNQEIENDIQRLRSFLTQAQQRSLNEIREGECLSRVGDDTDLQRRCSNIGVVFEENALRMFADLDDNKIYSDGADYLLEESVFHSVVEGTPSTVSVMFAADPPVILTYVNGALLSAGETRTVRVENGGLNRVFTIGSYGVIEYVEE